MLRYGTLHDFEVAIKSMRRVALCLKLPYTSVHRFLTHFEASGKSLGQLSPARVSNRFKKITPEVASFLKNQEILQAWACFSLVKRVKLLEE